MFNVDGQTFNSVEELQSFLDEQKSKLIADFKAKEKLKEDVNSIVSELELLQTEEEKSIAIELLMPFFTSNINLASEDDVQALSKKLGVSKKATASTSNSSEKTTTRKNSKTVRLLKVDTIKNDSPELFNALVEEQGFKLLEADESYLVVLSQRLKQKTADLVPEGYDSVANYLADNTAKTTTVDSDAVSTAYKLPMSEFELV